MTEFEKLKLGELMGAETVEVRLRGTDMYGVATVFTSSLAAVYYGADDGSDDSVIGAEEFNKKWQITSIFIEQ